MIEYAGLCIGVGVLMGVYSRSENMKFQILARIIQIDELKELGDLLDDEPLCNPVVAIFGTVGSNSAVETTRSGASCVFSEETATVCYKCTTDSTSEEFKTVMLYRNEVLAYVQFVPNSCCERVLEVGKPLTIIGKAERNKNGAPTIGRVYQVLNGRSINKVDELASDLKSNSESCEILCLLLTGIGVSILAVSFLRNHLEFSK
ncbi:hypothetical protein Bca101_016184 [Brassica carinata]